MARETKKPELDEIAGLEMNAEVESENNVDLDASKAHSLWVRPSVWEMLTITKEDIGGGTWNKIAEIFIEKMISSGLMSKEATDRIHEIAKQKSINIVPDSGWDAQFQTNRSWPQAAGSLVETTENIKKMELALEELVEVIEDHAVTLAEIEENREESES